MGGKGRVFQAIQTLSPDESTDVNRWLGQAVVWLHSGGRMVAMAFPPEFGREPDWPLEASSRFGPQRLRSSGRAILDHDPFSQLKRMTRSRSTSPPLVASGVTFDWHRLIGEMCHGHGKNSEQYRTHSQMIGPPLAVG